MSLKWYFISLRIYKLGNILELEIELVLKIESRGKNKNKNILTDAKINTYRFSPSIVSVT